MAVFIRYSLMPFCLSIIMQSTSSSCIIPLVTPGSPDSIRRFVRRGMNYSRDLQMHSNAIDFLQAWYNLVKPHQSLRLEFKKERRKSIQRTTAMAEGLTDHIWCLRELLTLKVTKWSCTCSTENRDWWL